MAFTSYVLYNKVVDLLTYYAVSLGPLLMEYEPDNARLTKILESMALGTAHITTPVFEIDIVMKELGTTIVIDNNEFEAIAEDSGTLLSKPGVRQ